MYNQNLFYENWIKDRLYEICVKDALFTYKIMILIAIRQEQIVMNLYDDKDKYD